MRDKPSREMRHKENIISVKMEITAIQRVIDKQKEIISDILSLYVEVAGFRLWSGNVLADQYPRKLQDPGGTITGRRMELQ